MASDRLEGALLALAARPLFTVIAALVLLVFLGYSVLVAQEVLVVLWFLLVLFTVYLAWRFLRAFETIAAAIDRYVDDRMDD